MKISIVTLSLNQQKYLREAMDSILGQGFQELDYIVVDPGSKDGSRELIARYAPRLAHTILEPDQGASDGLNKGFAVASGEIFGFVNADDYLFPGSLQRVSEFFTTHPECDIAFGNGWKVDGDGGKLRHYKARSITLNHYFYGGAVWLQQSTFFRASAFRRTPGFNLANRTCWDGELIVTMLKQGARPGYIDADLGAFRIHGESITGTGRLNEQYRKDCQRIFKEVQGHTWSGSDALRRIGYRGTGLALRVLSRITG